MVSFRIVIVSPTSGCALFRLMRSSCEVTHAHVGLDEDEDEDVGVEDVCRVRINEHGNVP